MGDRVVVLIQENLPDGTVQLLSQTWADSGTQSELRVCNLQELEAVCRENRGRSLLLLFCPSRDKEVQRGFAGVYSALRAKAGDLSLAILTLLLDEWLIPPLSPNGARGNKPAFFWDFLDVKVLYGLIAEHFSSNALSV